MPRSGVESEAYTYQRFYLLNCIIGTSNWHPFIETIFRQKYKLKVKYEKLSCHIDTLIEKNTGNGNIIKQEELSIKYAIDQMLLPIGCLNERMLVGWWSG